MWSALSRSLGASGGHTSWQDAIRILSHASASSRQGGRSAVGSGCRPMHAPGAAFSTAGGSDEAAAATLHGVPPAAYAEFSGQPDQEAPGDIAAMREALMKVLVHPIPRARGYTGQLSQHMVRIGDHNLIEPEVVLKSMARALLVIKHTLKEDGHVYIIENNPVLQPLLHEAAACCTNPNVWFYAKRWVPGTLVNYQYHRRLFKAEHQPNRRLFEERGLRMVNPHCPTPAPADAPLPRLSWEDKWALAGRRREPGMRELLSAILDQEDSMHLSKPPGTLRGRPKRLRLLVALDATRNAIALREASQRNIPTVSLVAHNADMSRVTYPVLGNDFHTAFVHFFLDWITKVVNVRPLRERADMGL